MSAVAVAVGAFAVGMAGLLNHFKYRATATRIIEQRLNLSLIHISEPTRPY